VGAFNTVMTYIQKHKHCVMEETLWMYGPYLVARKKEGSKRI